MRWEESEQKDEDRIRERVGNNREKGQERKINGRERQAKRDIGK